MTIDELKQQAYDSRQRSYVRT